jgi:hypothetical protein
MKGSFPEQIFEALTTGRVVSAVFFVLAGSLFVDLAWKPRYPDTIPRVGYGRGFVANLRNMMGYVMHYNDWVREGYEKVCTESLSGPGIRPKRRNRLP